MIYLTPSLFYDFPVFKKNIMATHMNETFLFFFYKLKKKMNFELFP